MDAFAKPATLEEVTLSNGLFSGKPDQTVYLLPEQVSQVSTKPESGSEASPVSSEKKRSLWDRLFGGD